MSRAVNGIELKFIRADELLTGLEATSKSYFQTDPPPYEVLGRHAPDFLSYTFFGKAAKPLPMAFSLYIGEICHHLRSTLDHVIWALAMKNGAREHRSVKFPVST